MTQFLIQAVQDVQQKGFEHNFTVVIVGGALVRLIGPKTKIKSINTEKRIIQLDSAENPGVRRHEDAKTIIDIDCIAFSNAKDPYSLEVRNNFLQLIHALKSFRENSDFPAISVEPVLYHPFFPKPHILSQFVSSIESYHTGNYFFRLGSVKKDVKPSSLDFWTYTFANTKEKIISFSPIAIQKRYAIRGFSVKPKDKEKIWGNGSAFATFVNEFASKTDKKYESYFTQWDEFSELIQSSSQFSMQIKRNLWNAYWNTIGTYLAHGTGLVGKLLLPLGNTFFAGK